MVLIFWVPFCCIFRVLYRQAITVDTTPRLGTSLRGCGAGWRFSSGLSAVVVEIVQKKDGKAGTTWGDNKKMCCVAKRRWLSGRTREAYLFLFITHFYPLYPLLHYSHLVSLGNLFKGKGGVTGGLKDGPSRHPEKLYPEGEGHERTGRGQGRGQLRQRLYGGSELPGAQTWIFILHLFHTEPPPYPTTSPSRLLVALYPPGGEAGAATLPSSFSSHFQSLYGGLALSPKPQQQPPSSAFRNVKKKKQKHTSRPLFFC